MAQLKTLDTGFLTAADPDRRAGLAIGAVAIVDGALPGHHLIEALLAERIRAMPRCAQVLRTDEWIDDPDFDLTQHVRRLALPRPGGEGELSWAIAHALERPLDPDRPLWECWVIQGLKGNRWAILMKLHHRLADGGSAAHLLTRLCDDVDADAFAQPIAPQPDSRATPTRGWLDAMGRVAALGGTVTGSLVGAMVPGARHAIDSIPVRRRYSTVQVPIADVDRVCRKFGVTANDVALAAITEGFRTVLLRRGEQPRADSLRALVPAPLRSVMLPYLPVEHDDPVQRLRTVHNRWKAGYADGPSGGILESAVKRLPSTLRGNVLEVLARLPQRGIVTLATSVPGPRQRLRLMGRTLERLLPIPPTAAQLSTGVAVLSYGDELVFGITAEHDAASDAAQLAAGIELGMARLVALSRDSVLLFGKEHRRKRSGRAHPRRPHRPRPSVPEQARH